MYVNGPLTRHKIGINLLYATMRLSAFVKRVPRIHPLKSVLRFVRSPGVTRGAYQCHKKRPRKYVGRLIDRHEKI